jgi:pimeloyl-ACP methyl ester carboxylesterase
MAKNDDATVSTDIPEKYGPPDRTGKVMCINSKSFHHIAYQDWGDINSPETIFCLHGLTRNSHDFDALAKKLSETRRVICPDTAGRGESDWLPDHEDYQIQQYNMDFSVLAASTGLEKFDIIGTSLGGMMGMVLAAMKNSPVRRLIVNDIAPEVPHSAMARLGSYLHLDPFFNTLDEVEAHLRKTLAPFNPMTDEDWLHLAQTSSRPDEGGYRLAFDPDISNTYGRRYWYLMYFNLWKYWVRIRCPVLILRGKDSDFLTEHLLDRMVRKLPKCSVVEFENTGHTPTLNAPEQIDPIIQWLDKTSKK